MATIGWFNFGAVSLILLSFRFPVMISLLSIADLVGGLLLALYLFPFYEIYCFEEGILIRVVWHGGSIITNVIGWITCVLNSPVEITIKKTDLS